MSDLWGAEELRKLLKEHILQRRFPFGHEILAAACIPGEDVEASELNERTEGLEAACVDGQLRGS